MSQDRGPAGTSSSTAATAPTRQLGTGLTLLVGGARSGKSDLSVDLGKAWSAPASGGSVTFVATSEALDDDMTARIEQHRLDRPADWPTVEAPLFGPADVDRIPDDHLLILDCLTLLVSNLLFAELAIAPHVTELAARLSTRGGPTIVVSNEVGMGIHPETALGRTYRDELGRANRIVADHSEDALLIVAGRALALEPITAIGPAVRQPPGPAGQERTVSGQPTIDPSEPI